MLFNSLDFLFFFVVVTVSYFLLPDRHRWKLLLFSSCFFYMFFVPVYILILGFTIIVDYFAGNLIEKSRERRRKQMLILSLVANIGVLAVFKYYNFLNDNISYLLGYIGFHNHIPYLSILLPIGLSFHTFQAMSYTIEVYRGNQKAEKHFGIYALYVMFYPQLVAGPIERPQNIMHQYHAKHYFDYDDVVSGLRLMLWGYFKKVVIADRLAIYVNTVYNHPDKHSAITLVVATIFFSFQIYCDFSGYSDIAIGIARIMGYKLMTNFKRPYFATSIKEFWSRWHISLSTWFRDYLYIPLGGNRTSAARWYFNIFIVFLISGLWHGASWLFVIWGALHATYQIAEVLFSRLTRGYTSGLWIFSKILSFFNIIITFTLVSLAWIFFRANSLNDAFKVVTNIFTWKKGSFFIGSVSNLFYAVMALSLLFLTEYIQEFHPGSFSLLNNKYKITRHVSYAALVIIILLAGVFNNTQFIYFQF